MDSKDIKHFTAVYPELSKGSVVELPTYGEMLRRLLGILGFTLLFTLVGVLVALSITPVYTSTATIAMEAHPPTVAKAEDVYVPDSSAPTYYETQRHIIMSRNFGEKVLQHLDSDDRKELLSSLFTNAAPAATNWMTLIPGAWLTWLPQGLFPGIKGILISKENPQEADADALWERFRSSLNVDLIPNSKLITISFEASDRKLAAKMANIVANAYIEGDMDARLETTTTVTRFLSDRLKDLGIKLEQAETALQAYREQEHVGDVQRVENISSEQLSALEGKLVDIQKNLTQTQIAHNQILRAQATGSSMDSIPAISQDSTLITLKAAQTDAQRIVSTLTQHYNQHNQKVIEAQAELTMVKAQVNERIQVLSADVEKAYQTAKANLESTQRAISNAKDKMHQTNHQGYELGILTREVESNKRLYNVLLTRLQEASETSGLETANSTVIDAAVPQNTPTKPEPSLIVLIATLIGLSLGVVWAFLPGFLDRSVKNSSAMARRSKLPVLGSLPHLHLQNGTTPLLHVRAQPNGIFGESLRTIRTGIMLSSPNQPRSVVLVTSSVANEGKSSLAATLAESLADLHKVLVIDANLRRPSLHKLFTIEDEHPGLSELVSGQANILDCLVKVENRSLFVLPAGAIVPNPLELLTSRRFTEVLQQLGESFEQIVIDGAPTLVVGDTLVLAQQASAVIYVVQANVTPYPLVQEGLKRLRLANANLIGGVLNQA